MKKCRFLPCIFLASLLLSGCFTPSRSEKEENILPMPGLTKSIDESLNTPFFMEGDWPASNWWAMFDSKELQTLIETALLQNPSLQAIEQRVLAAKEVAKVARGKLFPLIFFDADETWQELSKNGLYRAFNPTLPLGANLVDLTASFTYEFDFWSKYRNLFKAALGKERSALAEKNQTELIVTTSVAIAYFALKTNLIRESLYARLVEVRKQLLDLRRKLEANALLSKLEPLFTSETHLEAEKLLTAIRDRIANDRHLLNTLIGVGPDAPLAVDNKLPPIKKLVLPKTLSLDLISRRPDLLAEIWKVEALAHEVGAAKADFFPDINLAAFVGLESLSYSTLFNGSSFNEGLKPAIHLPIFTAGAIRANIRAKKALFDEAVFSYNNLILKSVREVADLLSFAKSVFEQKEEQDKIVKNAETRYVLTALRKSKGLDSTLNVLALEEEVIGKELERVGLLYQKFLASIQLVRALGGGYHLDNPLPKTAEPGEGHGK